ncbi:MAG: BA14K family protein [Pseudomonadota bacterium]
MKALTNSIAALAIGASTIVPMATTAQAHDRGYGHVHRHGPIVKCNHRNNFCRPAKRHVYRHGSNHNSNVAGAAVLGIIGGALIGSAIANSNNQPRYVAPRQTYNPNRYPQAPRPSYQKHRVVTHGGSLEPWSRGWYQYCDAKYRSFNPQKGTYRGYDGLDHFCVAR